MYVVYTRAHAVDAHTDYACAFDVAVGDLHVSLYVVVKVRIHLDIDKKRTRTAVLS